MITRSIKKEEYPELITMVSNAFSYEKGEKISRDFPLLFAQENLNHLWVAVDENAQKNKITSHAASFFTQLRADGLEIPVGGIGGVCTLTEHQGKGLASTLVEQCCKDLAAQGAVLAFLWTGQHDFYRKQGFELVGRQWIISIDPSFETALIQKSGVASTLRYVELLPGKERETFFPDAYGKLMGSPLGVKRNFTQFSTLLNSAGCRVFASYEGELLKSYMVMGKGKDLESYIHEWAGDGRALLALLAHILSTEKQELKVLTPQFTPEEVSWIYTLDEIGIPMQPGFMAMVKILNFPLLQELLIKRIEAVGLDIKKIIFERNGDTYSLGWDQDVFKDLSELEVLSLLFGPEPPNHQVLGAIFPIRLWWWGMDSV